RIDRESVDVVERHVTERLASRTLELMRGVDGIVVSDYDKGLLTPALLAEIITSARAAGLRVYIDPKPVHLDSYRGSTAITPNLAEAQAMTLVRGNSHDDAVKMGEKLLSHLHCEAVLLTRGEAGMTLFQRSLPPLQIPSFAREVYDVTGAGDSVISVLAL